MTDQHTQDQSGLGDQASTLASQPPTGPILSYDDDTTTKEHKFQRFGKIKRVAVFGYADAKPEDELYKSSYELAQVLAKHEMVVLNGGGPGVMDAATRGAKSVGGETMVVTFYPEDAPGFEGRYLNNKADTEIVTQNYITRMFKLMENADAFVICNGGTGTISELGTAWVMARLYFGNHKPFVLYGAFWRPVMKALMENMMMRGNEDAVFRIAETPEEVLAYLEEFDKELLALQEKQEEEA